MQNGFPLHSIQKLKTKNNRKKQQNNTETKPQSYFFLKEILFYSNFWIKSGEKIHKGSDLGKNVSTNSSPSTGANSNRLEKIKKIIQTSSLKMPLTIANEKWPS